MSIVVQNGIIFPDTDLGGAHTLLESFAPRIAALSEANLATFLADVACRRLDTAAAGHELDEDCSPLSAAWEEIDRGRQDERKGVRHPLTDFEFKIGLFAIGPNVYGSVQTERHRWVEIMLNELAPAVAEYAFWDNSDPAEDISVLEWRQRGKIWSEIIRRGRGRVAYGCSVDLTVMLSAPRPEALIAALPDFETRLSRTVKDAAVRHFLTYEAGLDDNSEPQATIHAVIESSDWMRTMAGRNWVDAARQRFRPLLTSAVTYEDLRQRPCAAVVPPSI